MNKLPRLWTCLDQAHSILQRNQLKNGPFQLNNNDLSQIRTKDQVQQLQKQPKKNLMFKKVWLSRKFLFSKHQFILLIHSPRFSNQLRSPDLDSLCRHQSKRSRRQLIGSLQVNTLQQGRAFPRLRLTKKTTCSRLLCRVASSREGKKSYHSLAVSTNSQLLRLYAKEMGGNRL